MSLSRRVVTLVYGRAFAFGLSLAIPLVLIRLLAKEEYGTYQQLVLLYATLQALLLFGMPRSLSYFYPRLSPAERPRLLRQTMALLGLSALLALALFLAAQVALGWLWPDHQLRPYLGLLGLYTGLMLLVVPLQNLLVVEGRERASAVSMVAFTVVDVVVMPAAAWLRPDVWGILAGIVIAAGVKAAVSVGYILRRYLRAPAVGPGFMRQQLAYGVPVGLMAMVGVINLNIDKYLVGLFFSTSVFAVYYIGSLWAPVFNWTTQSVVQVVIPRLSAAHHRGDLARMRRLRSEMARKMGLVYFPLAVLMALVAEPLITKLFTPAYRDAVPIFVIYLLLLFNRPFGSGEVLMATGQTRFMFRLVTAMMLLNIVLSYTLLTRSGLGLLALPVATVIVSWLTTLFIMQRSNATLELPLAAAYPWRPLALTLLVAAAAAAPGAALAAYGVAGWALLVGAVALYGVAFLALAWGTGALGRRDRTLLRALWPF